MMAENAVLRASGPNGESKINIGNVITTSHRTTNITLALENLSEKTVQVSVRLSESLSKFLSVSSVSEELKQERTHSIQPTLPLADPCAPLTRNFVYDFVSNPAVVSIAAHSRDIIRVSLNDVCVPLSEASTTPSEEKRNLRSFDGHVILEDASAAQILTTFGVYGNICESWLQPDDEFLDFGQCAVGSWVYRDVPVRNLSQIPARFSLLPGFRPSLEESSTSQIALIDPDTGYELDAKLIHILASSTRCVRIAFRAIEPIDRQHWLCLQNLDNSDDFWHLQVAAKAGAERLAQKILVSCGAELEFGDCYASCQTFRDVILQSNYDEDITLALMTDRPNQVSFEVINDWTIDGVHDVLPEASTQKTRSRTNNERDTQGVVASDTSDAGSVRRQSSMQVDIPSDPETVSSNSAKYLCPQPKDERLDSVVHNKSIKRGRLPETVLLRSGEKKGVRVWYWPNTDTMRRRPDGREIPDFDAGELQDDNFLLTFELSSGESRTVVAHSRVCDSVLRLERNETHLGECNVMTRYRTGLSLINCSDLPAYVSINYVSQCVFADTYDFRILPRQSYDLGFDFVPRQVNSGYHKEITISNQRNPKASNLVFTVNADCVDDQGISLHALFYKILAPNTTNEIDFGVTVANHQAVKAVRVRNLTTKRLVLQFDGCRGATTYVPSKTTREVKSAGKSDCQLSSKGACVCETKLQPVCPGTKTPSLNVSSLSTANALLDMDFGRARSANDFKKETDDIPVWNFESSFSDLQKASNSYISHALSNTWEKASHDSKGKVKSAETVRGSCWSEFFTSLSEKNIAILDSVPFFSNYDSELRYTEKQFSPERNLIAALRTGCLTASKTLELEPRSESVVVLSLILNDSDVRGKTKIRPIERHMSIRMVDFDRTRLKDLPATTSLQMHHIAKLFDLGDISSPREVLLTVRACKSRMSIAPLRQLNFGTIAPGEQKDKAFTIVNLSEAPLLYEVRKTGPDTKNQIRFNLGRGTQGVVRPYFTKVVPFIFAPTCEGKYLEKIVVENRLDSSASAVLFVKAHIRNGDDQPNDSGQTFSGNKSGEAT